MKRTSPHRPGFTLVEMLVVISIIGILTTLSVAAVMRARTSILTGFLKSECSAFETAIEGYKLKYGDYPPDFSNVEIVDRHYRRIFPEILDSELVLLFRLCDDLPDASQGNTSGNYVASVMDRAEALIWAVGGFSSDPQRPFTGTGGPLVLLPGVDTTTANYQVDPANYQYNSERDNALTELEASNLSIKSPSADSAMSYGNRAESDDELALAGGGFSGLQSRNDLFPVYRYREGHAPYVYFDSRTYDAFGPNLMVDLGNLTNVQLNGYAFGDGDEYNVVRPILSDQVSTNPSTVSNPVVAALRFWKFVNSNTFQVLSPGLDGVYGNIADFDITTGDSVGGPATGGNPSDGSAVYIQYPTGKIVVPVAGAASPASIVNAAVSSYNVNQLTNAGSESYVKDNVASFSKTSFEDDLP